MALTAAALVLTACTGADGDGDASPSAPVVPEPEPTTTITFEFPEPGAAGEAAFYRSPGREAGQSGEIIAGPEVLVADRPVRLEGACEGSSVPFEVRSALPDAAPETLVEGRLDCADPGALAEFTYSSPYEGPIQARFTNTDSIEQGWIRVVQD